MNTPTDWETARPDFFAPRDLRAPLGPPVFATGTGRCGTHFMAALFEKDPQYDARHADNIYAAGDAFYQYCRFHGLPVDLGGLFWSRRCFMDQAAQNQKYYFESNAIIFLNLLDLQREFDAVVLSIVRSPVGVVPSSQAQGVYKRGHCYQNPAQPIGFQYNSLLPNHFFANPVPGKDEYEWWRQLTNTGKVAWRWNHVNAAILDQLAQIPVHKQRIVPIEAFDYDAYLELSEVMPLGPVSRQTFDAIRAERPGKTGNLRPIKSPEEWQRQERSEFIAITSATAAKLGYDVERELFEIENGH